MNGGARACRGARNRDRALRLVLRLDKDLASTSAANLASRGLLAARGALALVDSRGTGNSGCRGSV